MTFPLERRFPRHLKVVSLVQLFDVRMKLLQFIQEVFSGGYFLFQTFPFPCCVYHSSWLGGRIVDISIHGHPVIKDALREGLATSVGSEVSSKSFMEKQSGNS